MTLQNFVFLDATSTSTTSNTLVNSSGKYLTLEVSPVAEGGTVAVTFEVKLIVIVMYSMTLLLVMEQLVIMAYSATASGIYYLDVNGIPSIQVVSTGTPGDTIVIGRLSV